MRIAVCIKQVLDPATIKVSRSRQAIDDRQAIKILNPTDRWALDTALRFKETDPSTELIALTIGNSDSEDILREALALGADRAIMLSDPVLVKATGAGRAKVLAAAIKRLRGVEMVLTGAMAVDTGRGELAPRLAIELGDWQVMMDVEQLTIEGRHVSGLQYIEDCYYKSTAPLPVVASIRETPEHPRYPHGAAIMNAYRARHVETWSSLSLGIDLASLPAPTTDRRLRVPPAPETGVMLDGSPAEVASALLANLRTRRVL
ncbi:MAG: electron transfer flavoprotein subunit beta/FixA family protein [Anaerolineae bacterium]|nr:electron transfer flavoprotein subunit beta/FixA family protein [Anaerolineae bacterium]MCB0249802.1 electron transfer flavoprotein subunit beta/FixA family protein [Anaerolineae bacterium]MCB9131463.1 electron transfer flavoprotein subunit beta/FixA family protein [Anaerolineales bacterium]MCO5245851.1 electron transfer flavoprotein subunit beta/FixA family protein [Anaerolineae bacterium]